MAKLNIQPPELNECKTYEAYKRELKAWSNVTDLPKNKQGNYIVLSLPNKSKFGDDLKERAFENINEEQLNSEEGLKSVIEFLDQELGKNAIDDAVEKWEEFDNCRKEDNQTLEEFISDFETKYNRIKASGTIMPQEILAFMLMKRAGLSQVEKMLVLARIDMEQKADLFKNVKTHMKNILGKRLNDQRSAKTDAIKLEPTFLAEHEDVLAAHGYYRHRSNTAPSKNKSFNKTYKKYENRQSQHRSDKGGRPINPLGKDGKPMLCKSCGSFRHFVGKCPDSHENKSGNVFITEEVEDGSESECYNVQDIDRFVLFTSESEELSKFTGEAINSAALDTCCTTSVAGENWLRIYLESLPPHSQKLVQGPLPGGKMFKFGNEGVLKSIARYTIPAEIGENSVMIDLEVIESDIPLLLSKPAMKRAKMKIDLEDDSAIILGKKVALDTTSAGHYVIPLLTRNDKRELNDDQVFEVEEVLAIDLLNSSSEEKKKALEKLHKQFGHRPKDSFVSLLKSAETWSPEMSHLVDEIIDNCEGCIKRKRNPDRPVVSMPMASEFNEKVAIDLSFYKGQIILHMIDMWSRLTVSAQIDRKRPSEVVEQIMKKWIAYFGTMGAILNDNGGEFTSEEMREVKSVLNVVDITTGAESPWQNGLCEKNHALIDNILERLDDDYPELDLDAKLAWAGMAKNSLQMVYGFSPNQLVYGQNPKLPNILVDGPPSWEESTSSEMLAKHLNLLHAARREFIKSESCARIKTALRSKIRCSEEVYENGDIVYYKRARDGRWMGPAKVVFQDGKIIFLRNGAALVRVSASRLVKAGTELAKAVRPLLETTEAGSTAQSGSSKSQIQTKEESTAQSGSSNPYYEIMEDGNKEDVTKATNQVKSTLGEEPLFSEAPTTSENQENTSKDSSATSGGKINLKRNDTVRFKSGEYWVEATITGRGKTTGKYKNWFNVTDTEGKEYSVDLERHEFEKVTDNSDEVFLTLVSRQEQDSPQCLRAKEEELKKLKEFNTYEEVNNTGQDFITSSWVLTHKEKEIRARLVARGFEEIDEIKSDSPTLSKSGLRIILATAATKGWIVETTDIKSAFLQGNELDREVYLKPPKEAKCEGKLWRLLVGLYGLKDAGRQWYLKVKEVLIKLGCEQLTLEPGLFIKRSENQTIGIIGLHVDDFLHAGEKSFNETVMKEIHKVFLVGRSEKDAFMYTGFSIIQDAEGIKLDQSHYVEGVEIPQLDPSRTVHKLADLEPSERTLLRKMAGSLNWIVRGSRPDLNFELIDLSTKFKSGKVEDLIRATKVLGMLKGRKAQILFPDLGNPSMWLLMCYSDASLGNINNGVDSVGGHFVLLVNKQTGRSAVLDWQSNKVRRVVRSTLAAETLSLCDGLENCLFVRDILSKLFNTAEPIPIIARVDNNSLVEAIYSSTCVADKRLRREMGAIKEMLQAGEINSVHWIPGHLQLADVLTKRGVKGDDILQTLQKGEFTNIVK